ncbi:MAG: Xaa-Pro peptidase family protein [Actinomycetota bacterium]|nr:Xaa-Pro peptidase family protein [Actinomycetota bacterium]
MKNGTDSSGRTLLVIGASQHDAAAYHLSGFLAPDPVICLKVGGADGGKSYLAVSSMEYGRAKKQARADEILSFDELGVVDLAKELKSGGRALAAAAANLLSEIGAKNSPVAVPPDLGILYADELRARGLTVTPEARLFADLRRSKTDEEISYIGETQRAVEAACAHAVEVLKESEVSGEGILRWRGETLTSEILRAEVDAELLKRGCAADGTITAGGPQAADPHDEGHGPLRAGDSIIVDIFPASKESRYYADMTRTFVKGEPSEELQKMYDAVLESQEAALAMIGPGVNGRDIHGKVSEILHEKGYKTLQHDQKAGEPLQEGFIHGTGHGVGLEIHEAPRVSTADETLVPGDVITIEPGLYDPKVGGVRIEDLVVVTEDGCRNLTDFPKEFRV